MTDYTPPLESGLRAPDATLSERIERHCTPTEAHAPGCYALVLSVPEDIRAQWEQTYDATPPYLTRVENAARTIYVGAGKDVYERLADHVDGDVRQTALTELCPPHTIHDVWFYDDATAAFADEYNRARQVATDRPEWYVHQR